MIIDGELTAGKSRRRRSWPPGSACRGPPSCRRSRASSRRAWSQPCPGAAHSSGVTPARSCCTSTTSAVGSSPSVHATRPSRPRPPTWRRCGRCLADFDAAAAARDAHALKRTDFDFHMELMRCSGNRFLHDMLATYNIIIIANTTGLLKPAEQSDREHHALMGALEARDPDRADRIDVRAPERRAREPAAGGGSCPAGWTWRTDAADREARPLRPRLREAARDDRRGDPGGRQQGQQAGDRRAAGSQPDPHQRRPQPPAPARSCIEQRSRQGFYIRSYTYAELAPLYELRAALEGMAMRLGLERGEKRGRERSATRSTTSTRLPPRIGGRRTGRPTRCSTARSSSSRATRS